MELGPASPRAVKVMERARQLAAGRDQTHLGCEHLFLALIEDKHGIPAQLLADVADVDALHQRLTDLIDSDLYNTPTSQQTGPDRS